MLQELHSTGVDLYLHQQGINTTTPAGKALFGMMGVFAEFERDELRKRDSLHTSVSDMVEERVSEELDFSGGGDAPRKRGRPRKIK